MICEVIITDDMYIFNVCFFEILRVLPYMITFVGNIFFNLSLFKNLHIAKIISFRYMIFVILFID